MPESNAKSLGRISGPLLKNNLVRNGVDLAFETDLLYFDVTNQKIGINTDSPDHQLSVPGTSRTSNLLADQLITVNNITIDNQQTISPVVGNLNVVSPEIFLNTDLLNFDQLEIRDREITTSIINIDLRLAALPSGDIIFVDSAILESNLTVVGSVEILGNTEFGQSVTDTVTFNATISSDIIPSQNQQYDLGKSDSQWQTFESVLLNGEEISTAAIDLFGVDIGLIQGNILYVAKNGTDQDTADGVPNSGIHQQAPWRTIKYALERAQPGDTVYIFPGTYQEQLPLVVPAGVTVKGHDIRNTIVEPAASFEDLDVFLVDGESTISDLTVKNFLYNSANNTGYAFRFVSGGKVTTRSPYIQNISVITKGSIITATDPRGFDAGDAGRGALIDGAEFDQTTNEASLLFHSVTFITPGVDCITMTNGVRVEWLNSFIYFADRGLVALQGTGRTLADGVTQRFGAEIRSIGSANVYGNVGAFADGADTLMYLINHNFGYIGSGKDSSNDPTLAVIENETQEFNSGKIYFQSQAHDGNFRVGDGFFVDQATGRTSINLADIAIGGVARLTVSTNGNITILDADFIETGNIVFEGNSAVSLVGDINLISASGEINFSENLLIQKNLSVANNLKIDGTLIGFGDQTTDVVIFDSKIKEDVKPNQTETHNLGSVTNRWESVWASNFIIDQTKISNNTIETISLNADLIFEAPTSNVIQIDQTDVKVNQSLEVQNQATFSDIEINAALAHIGNKTQTGNYQLTGIVDISGTIDISDTAILDQIVVDENIITTSAGNLVLKSQDQILVDTNDVTANQDLYVNGITSVLDVNAAIVAAQVEAEKFYTADIEIAENHISTNNNADLILKSTKEISVPSNDIVVSSNITVNDNLQLFDTVVNNALTHIGNRLQTGNYNQTGDLLVTGQLDVDNDVTFEEILFSDNSITTTIPNKDLSVRANGTGVVSSAVDTLIQQNLTVNGVTTLSELTIENFVNSEIFKTTDIEIFDNKIQTYTADQDLEVKSNTGTVNVDSITIDNNVISSSQDMIFSAPGKFVLSDSDTIVLPKGTTIEKTTFESGDFRLDTTAAVFEGYNTSRVGFGGVYSDDKQTSVSAHPFNNQLNFNVAGNTVSTIVTASNQAVLLHGLSSNNNLFFRNNIISTQEQGDSTLQNLQLSANGTGGSIVNNTLKFDQSKFTNLSNDPLILKNTGIGYVAFITSEAIMFPYGDSVDVIDPSSIEIGDTRWNTELQRLEVFDGEFYQPAAGAGDIVTDQIMQEFSDEWSLILG